jgi:outer membrane protein assembly factor BamB
MISAWCSVRICPPDHPGYAVPFAFKRDFKNRDSDKDGALTEAEWNRSVAAWEASSRPVLMAVRPGTDGGGGTGERVVWKWSRGLPEMPSFLIYRDRLYLVRDGGLLTCLTAADGRSVYQERVGVAGQYTASPVAADGRIYLASVSGSVTVVAAAGDTLEVLARNPLGEGIHATPAIAGTSLYVRTVGHVMAFDAVAGRR